MLKGVCCIFAGWGLGPVNVAAAAAAAAAGSDWLTLTLASLCERSTTMNRFDTVLATGSL